MHQSRHVNKGLNIQTEIIRDHYLVSCSETGAVSLFSPAEFIAFKYLFSSDAADPGKKLRALLSDFGCDEVTISNFTEIFLKKLAQQGWFRSHLPVSEDEKLGMVYLTVTKSCNLSCVYCYVGDERRSPDFIMKYEDAESIIKKIKDYNPNARIAVTGGEPLTHPEIFKILDALDQSGLKFTLGTNALLIDDACAKKLKGFKNLSFVQASLDGITPEIHKITRGDTFHETMQGVMKLINNKVNFAIAPTIHEGNLHEIYDIARFCYSNGGFFAPNHLRKFPHSHQVQNIYLKPDSLRECIIQTFEKAGKEFSLNSPTPEFTDKACDNLPELRCKFVCGNGWSTVDLDWNGDVYPCHLLREKEFIIGNILQEEFSDIFDRSRSGKTRVKSYDIPKCKDCPFVSTCAGGCRASAFFTKGTLAAEDEYCEILYKFEVEKLFLKKDIHFHF
ncbi:MAG: radical SAM protein [Bacteroidetes bacterium]|nr:radical SAM protein [Bacteroidota bacterium]